MTQKEEVGSSERQGVQVIARAAALLRALQHRPEGMTLGELARLFNAEPHEVPALLLSFGFFFCILCGSGGAFFKLAGWNFPELIIFRQFIHLIDISRFICDKA